MSTIADPTLITSLFEYYFLRNALIAGTIAAILAGFVGYFMIIRKLAFAGHALGHIGFAGATGAGLVGLTPVTGQLFLTLLAAIGIGAATGRPTDSAARSQSWSYATSLAGVVEPSGNVTSSVGRFSRTTW
jgi:zinc/manganese transport system permease protein